MRGYTLQYAKICRFGRVTMDLDQLVGNGDRNMSILSNTGNTETFYILN